MLLALALFTAPGNYQSEPAGIPITSGLAISGVSLAGRRPIPEDAIVDLLASGGWKTPREGEVVKFRGRDHGWTPIKVDKDGGFQPGAFGGGYVYVPIDVAADSVSILNVTGDSMVYVNGEARPGDPYGTGQLNLPVRFHSGHNDLLIASGRGRIKATLTAPPKPVFLQTGDATLPDILLNDQKPLWASMIVVNASGALSGLDIRATLPDGSSFEHKTPDIGPMTVRKEPFRIPIPKRPAAGDLPVKVELFQRGRPLDSVEVHVTVRRPLEIHTRTFVSKIDGSVQYYAVNPATKPSASNPLVLTLHGASVEAIGQARAYGQKEWVSLVAPTNRRPYAFDWEDIGREDALEVLAQGESTIPHDPLKVDLAGHSMGGHGTWSVGTLYPNLFASIAPSAGWISFWSYAGGWVPDKSMETQSLLRDSMDVSDKLGRVRNTLAEDVYILHGSADDNVPVTEARAGRAALEKIDHPHLEYHEQPGAGHWWGNQCVDWPPIFDMIRRCRLDPNPRTIDFTTQNPAVSGEFAWLTVDQQIHPLRASHVLARRGLDGHSFDLTTENVARLTLRDLPSPSRVVIDKREVSTPGGRSVSFVQRNGVWVSAGPTPAGEKSARRNGPFKQVFDRSFLFVVGTAGTAAENAWAANKARFDAETMLYRGNGSVDVILDTAYSPRRFAHRNVVLYGNADTNRAWSGLLAKCPIRVGRGVLKAALKKIRSEGIGALLVYPNPHDADCLVAAVSGTGPEGMIRTDRMPILSSGVAYPDWILLSAGAPASILGDGFFGNDWSIERGESAWASP